MIALAVLGMLLAGAAADTAVTRAVAGASLTTRALATRADTALRIPGTTLRLGLGDAAVSARGFAASEGGKQRGPIRFFGMKSEASLEFEDGRLARATFTIDSISPYEAAYVQDQLTAMGYRRRCERLVPGNTHCDWSGPVTMHIDVVKTRLTAIASRPARPGATAARESTAIGAPRGIAPTATRAPAETAHAVPSRTPARADTAPASRRDTESPPEGARVAAAPAPLLPETLAVEISGRPSVYAAAEVRREGHCEYPPAARRAGIQGRVWILATVDTSGAVIDAQISRGIPELNEAALCAARLWLFAPRAWQGRPCRYRVLVPVTFTLH